MRKRKKMTWQSWCLNGQLISNDVLEKYCEGNMYCHNLAFYMNGIAWERKNCTKVQEVSSSATQIDGKRSIVMRALINVCDKYYAKHFTSLRALVMLKQRPARRKYLRPTRRRQKKRKIWGRITIIKVWLNNHEQAGSLSRNWRFLFLLQSKRNKEWEFYYKRYKMQWRFSLVYCR